MPPTTFLAPDAERMGHATDALDVYIACIRRDYYLTDAQAAEVLRDLADWYDPESEVITGGEA